MILVTGANGYVGTHLVERLCGRGISVRALVRRGCRDAERDLLSEMGSHVFEADLEETPAVARALEGVRAVVHLIGSIERPPRGSYREMHTEKTRLLVRAFRSELASSRRPRGENHRGVRGRIIYLSALGATATAGNRYHRTKWEAEEEVRRSGCDCVILRASLVFGRETGRRDSKLVRKLLHTAFSSSSIPIIGWGGNRIQPIYIGDLVSCIEAAVCAPLSGALLWELGGPQALTLRETVATLLKAAGLQRRIIAIPFPAAFLYAICARLAGREERVNLEQVRMSRHDFVCSENEAECIVKEGLTGLEEGLRRSLRRFGLAALAGDALQ